MQNGYLNKTTLDRLEINNCDKLMIVAHPDDEAIWGGEHLISEGGYFVVCMTRSHDLLRKEEFALAIKASNRNPNVKNNRGFILPYSDNKKGIYGQEEASGFSKEIDLLLHYKTWKKVVTHNPKGEYGHFQHKLLSKITTELFDKEKSLDKNSLYYFGKYIKKKRFQETLAKTKIMPMNDAMLKQKKKLINIYVSQKKVLTKKIGHMIPYEYWEKAVNWEE